MTGGAPRRRAATARMIRAAAALSRQSTGLGAVTRRAARLSQALRAADHARAAALFDSAGSAAPRPALADWCFRPGPWQDGAPPPARPEAGAALAPGVKLFHDARAAAPVTARLLSGPPPQGLELALDGFDGSYLSLVFDLPGAALAGLSRCHLLGLGFVLNAPASLPVVFARLTIVCGPNRLHVSTRLVLPQGGGAALAEFDMLTLGLQERRVDSGWCDLVLAHPPAGAFWLADVALYRRPRAAV